FCKIPVLFSFVYIVPATSYTYTLSLHDALPILAKPGALRDLVGRYTQVVIAQMMQSTACNALHQVPQRAARRLLMTHDRMHEQEDRKSTRLNSSHVAISYAVFCLQKNTTHVRQP